MLVLLYLLFFFKQKTAYEMRISDWSSDVCSSDLAEHPERRGDAKPVADEPESADRTEDEDRTKQRQRPLCAPPQRHRRHQREPFDEQQRAADEQQQAESDAAEPQRDTRDGEQHQRRSDPHEKVRSCRSRHAYNPPKRRSRRAT